MNLKHIWLLVAASLILTLVCFELTGWDMAVQKLFYHPATGEWLWPKHEPILKTLLYDGIKAILIITFLISVGVLVFARKKLRIRKYSRGITIVALSLVLVPGTVAALKSLTNVACPCKLRAFGGNIPYVKVFQSYPENDRPKSNQECFPAAHASAGFSLMSLFFLFQSRKRRRIALMSAIALGWIMGIYKMAIGDHFLSHTLVSMELGWLIISAIAMALKYPMDEGSLAERNAEHSANAQAT